MPKYLYIQPLSSDMPTVPACEVRNVRKKSEDDSYLRDPLVANLYCNCALSVMLSAVRR